MRKNEAVEAAPLIAVIGSSAGGFGALRKLLKQVPRTGRLAIIIAQHLAPERESRLALLLQNDCALTVVNAEDGDIPLPDHVYVTPPGCDIRLKGGRLELSPPPQRLTPAPSVDLLLESLAEQKGTRMIAVILSGLGNDGADGVRSVRRQGGTVLAQRPGEAQYPGMPHSALLTGCVDYSADAAEIGRALGRLAKPDPWSTESEGKVPADFAEPLRRWTDLEIETFQPAVADAAIARRMALLECETHDDYAYCLDAERGEAAHLARTLLHPFGTFEGSAKSWLQRAAAHFLAWNDASYRVWLVGCATGHEAYSLAFALADASESVDGAPDFQIVATDLLPDVVSVARQGWYSENDIARLPPASQRRYFERHLRSQQVAVEIRKRTLFAVHDFGRDYPLQDMSLVVCRGMLPRLSPETQRRYLQRLESSVQGAGLCIIDDIDLLAFQ
jgi:two-component system CheB/CheR fusion protein